MQRQCASLHSAALSAPIAPSFLLDGVHIYSLENAINTLCPARKSVPSLSNFLHHQRGKMSNCKRYYIGIYTVFSLFSLVDSSGNLKDASEIVFYNSESDEVPLPCVTGPTGEHATDSKVTYILHTDVDFFFHTGSRCTARSTKNNLSELLDAEKRNSDGKLMNKKSKKRSKKHHKVVGRVTKKSATEGDVDMDEGDIDFSESRSSDSDGSGTSENDEDVPVVSNAEVSNTLNLE